ncbi:MAG: AI-2E family transporter [Gammaproteobacteria bacterium]|nr:AI-2E family transporter [Gammaproteobacteria bacterium]
MSQVIRSWFHRYFSDPQAILLAVLLVVGFTVVLTIGSILAPVLGSIVLAYLLDDFVEWLERRKTPRFAAVTFVFLIFLTLLLVIIFGLMPLLSRQITQFFQELPNMIAQGQQLLMQLPERYPAIVSSEQVSEMVTRIHSELGSMGQNVVSISLSFIPGFIAMVVYLILVPLMVFFFLKDKQVIVAWITGLLPRERSLPTQVWHEMDIQIGNYVRGKVWEIIIVGGVSYAVFTYLGLNFTPLLAVLVGLSVIIPYVGATVVTFPVAMVAYFQWGWGEQFAWLVGAYGVIQALDGNVLVPLLFSEAVNLHPVAIIVAVLGFGGLWGFWGVFFAIPLATLVKVLLTVWPRQSLAEDVPVTG